MLKVEVNVVACYWGSKNNVCDTTMYRTLHTPIIEPVLQRRRVVLVFRADVRVFLARKPLSLQGLHV
jgi:hypothetical protein